MRPLLLNKSLLFVQRRGSSLTIIITGWHLLVMVKGKVYLQTYITCVVHCQVSIPSFQKTTKSKKKKKKSLFSSWCLFSSAIILALLLSLTIQVSFIYLECIQRAASYHSSVDIATLLLLSLPLTPIPSSVILVYLCPPPPPVHGAWWSVPPEPSSFRVWIIRIEVR
jgi:hypothetical protein